MMPRVSVIVATYRRDESLRRALASLAKQTYSELEIVIVDDNDDVAWNQTVERIVSDFRLQFSGRTISLLVNHPNLGSARARNAGIDVAKGEYITFLDDDDIYLPDKILNQVQSMSETNADYGFTDLCLYYENDKLADKRIRKYIKQTDVTSLLAYHLKYHMTGTDTFMFRREYLVSIGAFEPIDVGDEFYLMQKAIIGGGKFNYLPRCDVKAYIHIGDVGLSSGQGKIDGENALYEYKKQFFDKVDAVTRRYIKMRHYAVLAFAALKLKCYGMFFATALKSFLTAPIQCIKLILERKI